jgi:hypothetical protein
MILKVPFGYKGSSALSVGTGKFTLASMGLHVDLKVAFLCKIFRANLTLKWLYTNMGSFVDSKPGQS